MSPTRFSSAALLVLCATLAAGAQQPWAQIIPYPTGSGPVANPTNQPAVAWTETITVPFAGTIMLFLDVANLGSDEDLLVISGVQDGEIQRLDRHALKRWGGCTALFNGPSVVITLHLAPGSRAEVRVDRLAVGAPAGAPESLCGGDNRVASSDARVCRLLTPTSASTVSVCTGWLIDNRSTILSAGHCAFVSGTPGTIAHFNVPASTSSGGMVAPPVADQFPVDQSSVVGRDNGLGDDWSVLRLHPNSSGETAFDRQGSAFTLATSLPVFVPGFGPTLRVTGFGGDSTPLTRNFTNQTSTGPLAFIVGDTLFHSVDTEGGNSGGPIILTSSGQAIGIHTNGGCDVPLGTNSGTSILNSALQAAIPTVSGCQSATLVNGASQSFSCPDVVFDIDPDDARWNVVGVSSTSDWDIRLDGVGSAFGGNTCDFLLANGHLGSVPPRAGTISRFSGSATGRGQLAIAEPLPLGTSVSSTWSSTRILRVFEVNVSSAGTYDITVNGDPSLDWRLYAPGTNAAWRPRSSSTAVANGSVGGPRANGVGLGTGWHCLVVFRNGNAAAPSPSALTLSVCANTASIALASGVPQSVTAACQDFSVASSSNVWSVVAISSPSDWDVNLGPAQSQSSGSLCDYAVANGTLGTVSPTSGTFSRQVGTSAAVADFKNANTVIIGTPLDTAIVAGHVVKPIQFNVTTAATYRIQVTGGGGDGNLFWRLHLPGSDSRWRPRADSVLAGTVGSAAASTIALAPGMHLLLVYRNGGPASVSAGLTAHVCQDVSPITLAGTGTVTVTQPCQPFSMTPVAGRWNVVGVTSTSDWDLAMGPFESQLTGPLCDFLVANGHNGTISPGAGVVGRQSGIANARLQHGSITTLTLGSTHTFISLTMPVVSVYEFNVAVAGPHDITINGPTSLRWRLFAPGSNAQWRDRFDAILTGTVGGNPATAIQLGTGWHAIVLLNDGNATGSNVGVSVRVEAHQLPMPVLTGLTPTSISAGGPGFILSALGSGFVSQSVVRWNGTPLSTSFVSSSRLDASVPAALRASAATAQVTVHTPAPGGGTSSAQTFTVLNPAPSITGLAPASLPAGSPATTVLVNGAGFVSTSTVQLDGANLPTTFVSPTQLSASVSATRLAAAGTIAVTVHNPSPGGGTSAAQTFSVLPPALLALSPSSIPVMLPIGPPVTITAQGLSFVPGISRVFANGVALVPIAATGTQLVFVLDPAQITQALKPGAIAITVESSPFAQSNSLALPVDGGTGGDNRGIIRRAPLAPAPGEGYAMLMEDNRPGALFSVYIDLENPAPVTSWPNAAANQVLAVGPFAGTGTLFFPLVEGIGLHGPASGATFDANGEFFMPGFVAPNPPLGIELTVQGIYLDASAPLGFKLTWARFPDQL